MNGRPRPHTWDTHEVLRFCLIMGPLSSVFDIATFIVLVRGFAASAEVLRTAWFVESMATQILVVFLIRTALPAWVSRPNPVLVASSLATLGAAIVIALAPAGHGLGKTTHDNPTAGDRVGGCGSSASSSTSPAAAEAGHRSSRFRRSRVRSGTNADLEGSGLCMHDYLQGQLEPSRGDRHG
ncbi:cation transporting ATPase C-terminal domain-containing protein [Microvirga sp. M2]|uniref:cation transporting ATPase C-terminal domain-containing protein n=1 Tax=Microvirga sp. M2 TaxID=3073270 RepID=UPI0039C48458